MVAVMGFAFLLVAVLLIFGPVIEHGFFYDFAFPEGVKINEGDFEAIEAVAGSAASTPCFDAMHAGLAATTALRWIAGRDPFVPGQLQVIEPVPTIGVTAHWVLRVPRCPACSGLCDLPRPLPWHEAA